MTTHKDKKRVVLLSVSLVFLMCLVLGRYYVLQIIQGEEWVLKAKGQHELLVTEPFNRGRFLTNRLNGDIHPCHSLPVAQNLYKFHLYADCVSIAPQLRDEVAYKVIEILNLDKTSFDNLRSELEKRSRSRRLFMWLDRTQRETLEKWWRPYARKNKLALNALYFVRDSQRVYPYGPMLGQVLHTIRDDKDQITKQGIPTGGLELQMNKDLKGSLGKRLLLRSPRHAMETGKVLQAPQDGHDVLLTIDPILQAIAEKEVRIGAMRAKAKTGWALMIEPQTGKIMALAQYPYFWPEKYQEYYNDPTLSDHTRLHAVLDVFEPGSPTKALNMAVCLQANEVATANQRPKIFSTDEKIATSNGRFPGRLGQPIHDTKLHYYLNFDLGIQKSSNIYMGRVTERVVSAMGVKWYYEKWRDTLGFGKATGVEYPAEAGGMLPKPGALHPNGSLQWSLPTPYSLAMGYNFQATNLQMVRAYSLLANGGYEVRPTFLADAQPCVDTKKQFRRLDPHVIQQIQHALKFVTKPGGAAVKADIPGYTEMGKTGTTRKLVGGLYSKQKYFSSFIGFCPEHNPRFVLAVCMDEATTEYFPEIGQFYYGAANAAPVFKEIAKRALKYLGVAQDDPYGDYENPENYDVKKSDWYEESQNLLRLYEQWNLGASSR